MQLGGIGVWEWLLISAICFGPVILAIVVGLVIVLFKALDSKKLTEDFN